MSLDEDLRAAEEQTQQDIRAGEMQQIIAGFIRRTPPCQLTEVLKASKILTQVSQLPREMISQACREHHESTYLPVLLGADAGVGIICARGRAGGASGNSNSYVCPRGGSCVFEVEFDKGECLNVGPNNIPTSQLEQEIVGPVRCALEQEMEKYVAGHFPPRGGIAGSAVFSRIVEEGREVELQVILTSRHSRPRACWAGMWSSNWTVTYHLDKKDSPAALRGTAEFVANYTEEANVHFRRKSDVMKASISPPSDGLYLPFAVEVVAAISKFEEEFHDATEGVCLTFGNTALKSMRRVLPLSKERFDWKPIRHSLVRDLKAAGKDAA